MLTRAKTVAQKGASRILRLPQVNDLTSQEVAAARDYIANYWHNLERVHPKDDGSSLGMPRPYLVPSYEEGREFDFNELYYWDTFFMAQGLFDAEHETLVRGMLEDLVSLFRRFQVIPNASRTYLTGRSQPPFLSTFIFDVYDAYKPGLAWLREHISVAEQEYNTVWMGTSKPHARQVYKGLSRYYDINMTHDLAEAESGWDYTPRFSRQCLNYLPVDLNSLLYKYETDFERAAKLLDEPERAAEWAARAAERKKTMNDLMWSKTRKQYYDYNYAKQRKGGVESLATFYPMWAGMVTKEEARHLVKALRRYEQKGGLATTDNMPIGKYVPGAMPVQWAYPNGWAPLHFIVVKGLQRYGYKEDARRIAMKWLRTNLQWFEQHGVFLEKYNVVSPTKPPVKGVYPSQTGFGWTNAIFERFCREFIDKLITQQ